MNIWKHIFGGGAKPPHPEPPSTKAATRPDRPPAPRTEPTPDTPKPLSAQLTKSVHEAVAAGDVASLQRSLSDRRAANAPDANGVTPLIAAAFKGNAVIVRTLLEHGADPNLKDTKLGVTALLPAALQGQSEIVSLLLDGGADVLVRESANGLTALYLASQNGHVGVASLLLTRGAEPDARVSDGRSPLWQAASAGHQDVVRLLLSKGAQPNVRRGTDGCTPLITAASGGHVDVVRALLEQGADRGATLKNGKTGLDIAREAGHGAVVRLLEAEHRDAKDARPLPTRQEFMETWLHVGTEVGIEEVTSRTDWPIEKLFTRRVELLLERSASRWKMSQTDCLNLLKQYERISDREFAELYQGRL